MSHQDDDNNDDDHLAYGEYHGPQTDGQGGNQQGFLGHTWSRFKSSQAKVDPRQHDDDAALAYGAPPSAAQPLEQPDSHHPALAVPRQHSDYPNHLEHNTENTKPLEASSNSTNTMAFLFDKLNQTVHDIGHDIKEAVSGGSGEVHGHTHSSGECSDGAHSEDLHRFQSFAPQRDGNDAKWFVDACGYMWAVSMALERAQESIWILDWWLSPELYLRRPPAKNEQYRIDRLLLAAAERGVKVNIIVYKEVTQALTRKLLNPILPNYLHSLLPRSTDSFTSSLTRLGLDFAFKSLEILEETNPLITPPISVSSAHTKHHLEQLHPNIAVFRHPDHLIDQQALASNLWSEIQNQGMSAATIAKLPLETLKAIYGSNEETVLYWAHHEKLCLIDGHTAFMGGIDLCYGRWDTNQHSIADAHPSDLEKTVFPGQDYNNARIMDFQDVSNWQANKLDRRFNSRMGWSDFSICLSGPVVEDLKQHFAQRWNFLYKEKYASRDEQRYSLLSVPETQIGIISNGQRGQATPGADIAQPEHSRFGEYFPNPFGGAHRRHGSQGPLGGIPCQIVRSCAMWSHGSPLEHSIASAYIATIRDSKHFIYIENQFFITATGDKQKPIDNRIGAAIVERIVRAAREGEPYKVIVVMPAVPAFSGDLKSDDALSTRAIMEFQYNSINRGGHSIMETLANEGVDPSQYIRFYNLRSYDRINTSSEMQRAEQESGVNYDQARLGFDERYGPNESSTDQHGEGGYTDPSKGAEEYRRFQEATQRIAEKQGTGRWDSVAECYMLGGEDIRNVPWEDGTTDEIDAFVSEELYVHSKLLIADDRIVICGSANLNDRSQLGDHDSEIAIRIEDPHEIDSTMAGRPWRATKFAASLRRHLFKKHLGLLPAQDYTRPDENFEPIGIPNKYDWGTREDEAVADPLGDEFQSLWNGTARTNTESFGRVFHPVPTDEVKNWKEYDEYYERFFKEEKKGDEDGKDKDGNEVKNPEKEKPSTWKWGHVVAEDFPGGVEEVKEVLSRIRGTLVEMPLLFLKEEDIAKTGLSLNILTEVVYT